MIRRTRGGWRTVPHGPGGSQLVGPLPPGVVGSAAPGPPCETVRPDSDRLGVQLVDRVTPLTHQQVSPGWGSTSDRAGLLPWPTLDGSLTPAHFEGILMAQPGEPQRDYIHWITAGVVLTLIVVGIVMYWQRGIDYTTDTSVFRRDENPPTTVHKRRDPVIFNCNVPCVNSTGIPGGN